MKHMDRAAQMHRRALCRQLVRPSQSLDTTQIVMRFLCAPMPFGGDLKVTNPDERGLWIYCNKGTETPQKYSESADSNKLWYSDITRAALAREILKCTLRNTPHSDTECPSVATAKTSEFLNVRGGPFFLSGRPTDGDCRYERPGLSALVEYSHG